MNQLASLCLLFTTQIPPVGLEPIRIVTLLAPRPYYVGQAIEVTVKIDPDLEADAVQAPKVSGAELLTTPSDSNRAGEYRYLMVPKRGGVIELPPFRARSGGRAGTSRSNRIVVTNVPTEGRDSAFLGGVGPFDVRSEAEPLSVRTGQTLEYRVIVSGQAAAGSVRTPDLSGWKLPTLRIEPLDSLLQLTGIPTRTYRYRIRPSKGGSIVLPQVAVAAFDPTTQRYATKRTSSLAIRVEELVQFDPGRLDYGPPRKTPTVSRLSWGVGILAVLGIVSGSVTAGWFLARRRRRIWAIDPVGLAWKLSRDLVAGLDAVDDARTVAESLTTYLHQVAGRPDGVLTPTEARGWFAEVSRDEDTAHLAECLMKECDRARYGSSVTEGSKIIREGRQFLEDLATLMAKGGEDGKGVRRGEAVETDR